MRQKELDRVLQSYEMLIGALQRQNQDLLDRLMAGGLADLKQAQMLDRQETNYGDRPGLKPDLNPGDIGNFDLPT